jgi:hypothetical protein
MRLPDVRPAPSGFSERSIAEGQALFQRRATRPFTEADARDAAHNLTGAFSLLVQWKRERLARDAGDRPAGEGT